MGRCEGCGRSGSRLRCRDSGDRAAVAGHASRGTPLCSRSAWRGPAGHHSGPHCTKEWLATHQFPVGPFRSVRSLENMRAALDAFGRDCFVKSARGGYDGRSQIRITPRTGESAELAWRALGQRPSIAEQAIALEREISVLVARTPSGALKSFPSATNHHENQILAWSVIPSSIPAAMEAEAQRIACSLAEKLGLEGILAVEMFVTQRRQAPDQRACAAPAQQLSRE